MNFKTSVLTLIGLGLISLSASANEANNLAAWNKIKEGKVTYQTIRIVLKKEGVDLNWAPQDGPDKGISILWLLLNNSDYARQAQSYLEGLASGSMNGNAGPEDPNHPDHGITVAWLLAESLSYYLCKFKGAITVSDGPRHPEHPMFGMNTLWKCISRGRFFDDVLRLATAEDLAAKARNAPLAGVSALGHLLFDTSWTPPLEELLSDRLPPDLWLHQGSRCRSQTCLSVHSHLQLALAHKPELAKALIPLLLGRTDRRWDVCCDVPEILAKLEQWELLHKVVLRLRQDTAEAMQDTFSRIINKAHTRNQDALRLLHFQGLYNRKLIEPSAHHFSSPDYNALTGLDCWQLAALPAPVLGILYRYVLVEPFHQNMPDYFFTESLARMKTTQLWKQITLRGIIIASLITRERWPERIKGDCAATYTPDNIKRIRGLLAGALWTFTHRKGVEPRYALAFDRNFRQRVVAALLEGPITAQAVQEALIRAAEEPQEVEFTGVDTMQVDAIEDVDQPQGQKRHLDEDEDPRKRQSTLSAPHLSAASAADLSNC